MSNQRMNDHKNGIYELTTDCNHVVYYRSARPDASQLVFSDRIDGHIVEMTPDEVDSLFKFLKDMRNPHKAKREGQPHDSKGAV